MQMQTLQVIKDSFFTVMLDKFMKGELLLIACKTNRLLEQNCDSVMLIA